MLVAVIRLPEWDGSSEEEARPKPAPALPFRAADVQARAAALLPARRSPGSHPGDTATMLVPAAAASQPGHAGYKARHAGGPALTRLCSSPARYLE
jgi:hypothetical protein